MKCDPVVSAAAVYAAAASSWVFPEHIDIPNEPTLQPTGELH